MACLAGISKQTKRLGFGEEDGCLVLLLITFSSFSRDKQTMSSVCNYRRIRRMIPQSKNFILVTIVCCEKRFATSPRLKSIVKNKEFEKVFR